MSGYVFKLYRRFGAARGAKVISRTPVDEVKRADAINKAKVLFAKAQKVGDFAMLFVKDGDVVWISETADAPSPKGEKRPPR